MEDHLQNIDPGNPREERVLVLGIGNPGFGDDGAGILALKMLAQHALPPFVRLEEAGLPGLGLPNWLEGWSTVILVDAVDMDATPGSWKRFQLPDVQLWLEGGALSLHQPDLASGLALAQALDLLPQNLWLYGIQPAEMCIGESLSPSVAAGLPGMVDSLADFCWQQDLILDGEAEA
jgi:hydrogenase maturation protease